MSILFDRRRARAGVVLLGLLLVSAALAFKGLNAEAQTPPVQPDQESVHGQIHFDLPTLTDVNPEASVTLDTPVGKVTLSAKATTSADPARGDSSALTSLTKSCEAWYTIPGTAAFGVMNSFSYDYNSVTWLGTSHTSKWAVPPGHVDSEQHWETWWPGIQYAYQDGAAEYKQGIGPLSVTLGHFHVWIQEDAWGNCPTHGTYTF